MANMDGDGISMTIILKSDIDVSLYHHVGDEADIAAAARVSTIGHKRAGTDPGRDEGLIRYLVRNKHYSPLEHCFLTFHVNVPVFVSRQLVRHRGLHFNETSGRYRELEPVFYVPLRDRPLVQQGKVGEYIFTEGSVEQYVQTVEAIMASSQVAWDNYQHILNQGVAQEVARSVLPVNIYTQLTISGTLRNWMQFLDLRLAGDNSSPQYETAQTATAIAIEIEKLYPTAFTAWLD